MPSIQGRRCVIPLFRSFRRPFLSRCVVKLREEEESDSNPRKPTSRRSRRSRLVLFPMKYRPQAATAPNFLDFLGTTQGHPFSSLHRRMG